MPFDDPFRYSPCPQHTVWVPVGPVWNCVPVQFCSPQAGPSAGASSRKPSLTSGSALYPYHTASSGGQGPGCPPDPSPQPPAPAAWNTPGSERCADVSELINA